LFENKINLKQLFMKFNFLKIATVLFFVAALNIENIEAQEQSLGAMVTKKVGMYVYPAKGQSAEQTENDEEACYKWAVQQSGYDPLNPTTAVPAQVDSGPDGSAVKGAAGGALVGLAIGSISGHAGEGAAYGAIGGALAGRRRGNQEQQQQQQANNQAAAQANANMVDSFKKAYSVCLEGKGYTVQ
jgi:hypothetical protein